MSALLRWPLRVVSHGLFALLDHLLWLLIHLLPGPRLMALARQRPWRRARIMLSAPHQRLWADRVAALLRARCRRARWGSTCLSRSLGGRLLLDLIGVENDLHLGMCKFSDGRKVPHAWLSDPRTGRLLTPGLTPGGGASLTRF